MGAELWQQVWEEIQEAIALALILYVPTLISKLILGQEYEPPQDFNKCSTSGPSSVESYACYTIVISDFLLWIGIAGRVLFRFGIQALSPIFKALSRSKKN
ncbi:MAG: hypothetical protein HC899_31655 [Leptolyngbyaceae cyanobacterium SM1_4_3]|nr:hypothetical protein [Leptolyngbyaceae cyanobacterium SM1_4_3]